MQMSIRGECGVGDTVCQLTGTVVDLVAQTASHLGQFVRLRGDSIGAGQTGGDKTNFHAAFSFNHNT